MPWCDAARARDTPYFDGIRPLLRELSGSTWPTLSQLNALAVKFAIRNALGIPIRFVPPSADAISAMRYETRIAESGEVPTRDNWHDLFNALQWIAFPCMKSALNTQHVRLLVAGGASEATARSVARDVLTIFDESGVIVASADQSLLELVRAFKWHELFVDRREEVIARVRFILVGHGLMEKSLAPFIGMTAKAMLLNLDGQSTAIDQSVAKWLLNDANISGANHLAPLPLLGIPGWDARSESASFYDNVEYFRPGRRIAAGRVR